MGLIVGHTPVARTSSLNIRGIAFSLISLGLPVRFSRGCLLDLDVIAGLRPAALSKEATHPLFEAPWVGRVFADAGGLRCGLFCVVLGPAPRAFGRSGIVIFEEPEDGDAADDHDEGERYNEHPKADGRSSKLRHLELARPLAWHRLGCRGWLNGDRVRGGLHGCGVVGPAIRWT